MKILLGVFGVLAALMGVMAYMQAQTVMQQIVGASIGVSGAVMFTGAGIMEAIESIPLNQSQFDAKAKKKLAEAKAKAAAAGSA